MTDKVALLRSYLEDKGLQLPSRQGWTKVSCFNKVAHPRGDRNPSASVNLTTGHYKCFACGLSGDAYDLLMLEQGIDFRTAQTTLGDVRSPRVEEPTWL